jgi:hypothetical protein
MLRTNEAPRWSEQAKIPTDKAVVPSRSGSSVREDKNCAVSRCQCNQDHDKDDEEDKVKDTSQQFDPGYHPERVHIHQGFDDEHGEDYKSKMPSLGNVVRVVQSCQSLNHCSRSVGDSRKKRYPSKPSHPAWFAGEVVSIIGYSSVTVEGNQPCIQVIKRLCRGGARKCVQWYCAPAMGCIEAISAKEADWARAPETTTKIPHASACGPPFQNTALRFLCVRTPVNTTAQGGETRQSRTEPWFPNLT